MKVIGTGLSGMLGTRVVELLSPAFAFENLSLEIGIDITDPVQLEKHIITSDAPWVFHFAAKTDVDGSEGETSMGEKSPAWIVNVGATEHLAAICQKTHKRLLYISTDYVFDGKKDVYTEKDAPTPLGWYAKTKAEGEKRVMVLGGDALIVRTANPYGVGVTGKKDFVHKILERLQSGQEVVAPEDQQFVPTFVDDIAKAIEALVGSDCFGIYHVVGGSIETPYSCAQTIAELYGLPKTFVKPTTFEEFFKGRAPRPYRAILKHDKIDNLGVMMHTFSEGLKLMKKQEL